MIYKLSCFFRDLAVAGDTAMFENFIRALDKMTRDERIALRDAALHLAKTIEHTL